MKVAKISGMKLNSTGSGYVVKQNIKEGASLRKGDFLIVDLKTTEEKLEMKAKEAEENTEGSEGELENLPRD
jgi:penicillin-binding protein 2B